MSKREVYISRKRIRSQMALYGMTQADLSKKLGIPESSMCEKLRCNRLFNENEIGDLIKLFGKQILLGDISSQNCNDRKEKQ